MDAASRADHRWKEATKYFELAKAASSPFMRAYYQRVAERYLSAQGELRPPRYRHADAAAEAEIVVLHSLATLHMKRPDVDKLARPAGRGVTAEREVHPVFFLEHDRFLSTQIYERSALKPGWRGRGPALIEEYGSSTLIGPDDAFTIGKLGEIDIDCSA
jgi:N-methylhydantoinase A